MTPPAPAGNWYDRRPEAMGIAHGAGVIELGNGDYRCSAVLSSSPTNFTLQKWSGYVYIICVPISGALQSGRVFYISINDQYHNPGQFNTYGSGSIPTDLTVELSSSGLNLQFRNMPKCTVVMAYGTELIGRFMWGEESDLSALRRVPVLWGGQDADGLYSPLQLEDRVYLGLNPTGTFRVFAFNFYPQDSWPSDCRPIVKGDEAGSGELCDVVGGDYGIEVTVPDISFETCWLLDLDWWCGVAEI